MMLRVQNEKFTSKAQKTHTRFKLYSSYESSTPCIGTLRQPAEIGDSFSVWVFVLRAMRRENLKFVPESELEPEPPVHGTDGAGQGICRTVTQEFKSETPSQAAQRHTPAIG